MKVALVHEWLVNMRGGERVLEALAELFPEASIYTLFYRKRFISSRLRKRTIHASFLQWLPWIEKYYRWLLPLFPFAISSLKLKDCDVVISSNHCVAKGVRLDPSTAHICYCHTPMRYAWGFQEEYLRGKPYKWFAKLVLSWLRLWDITSAREVNHFVANSDNVKERIARYYGREAAVIHPPVRVKRFALSKTQDPYFLIVSALVPYKRVDLAVEAFNELGLPLLIIGSGPCEQALRHLAKANITFLKWCYDWQLKHYYARCQALVFPGEEDFGIAPVEAQAAGRPVIAFGRGGVTETVIPANPELPSIASATIPTGIFFYQQDVEALKQAVRRYFSLQFQPEELRQHVLQFDRAIFQEQFQQLLTRISTSRQGEKVVVC